MRLKQFIITNTAAAIFLSSQAWSFSFMNGDMAEGGIGYAAHATIGAGEFGVFSNHTGGWSWEDQSLFEVGVDDPVGWTHTSRWIGINLTEATDLTLTILRDDLVPYGGSGNVGGFAATDNMFPSFTVWQGWDNDVVPDAFKTRPDIVAAWAPFGGVPADLGDHHTYTNFSNVDWAEDISYMDHLSNSVLFSVSRTWSLAPGYYTFALGSNASAIGNPPRQGFSAIFATPEPSRALLLMIGLISVGLRRRR